LAGPARGGANENLKRPEGGHDRRLMYFQLKKNQFMQCQKKTDDRPNDIIEVNRKLKQKKQLGGGLIYSRR